MATKKLSCIICGKEYPQVCGEILKIPHPTKPSEVAYACRTHYGIEKEHLNSFSKEAQAVVAEM